MLQARFVSPSSRQFVDALFELTCGDALNGSFEAVVSVARYAEAGTWNAAYFLASDLAGNWTYLVPANAPAVAAASFELTGTSDVTPPVLVSLSVEQGPFDVTTGPAIVHTTATMTDDLSGLYTSCTPYLCSSPIQARFVSPSGNQFVDAVYAPTSGDALGAILEADMVVPRYAEAGLWQAVYFLSVDQVGNYGQLTPETEPMLVGVAFGVEKEFTGTIPSTGGTVTTDVAADGATSIDPIEVAVASSEPGTMQIVVGPIDTPAPAGWEFLGNELDITFAPDGAAPSELELTILVDASVVPAPPAIIDIFRGATLVPDCSANGGARPCVDARTALGDGDVELRIFTDHLSAWNLGVRTGFAFAFDGFFSPIEMGQGVVNVVKAGAAVPAKFSLGGDQGFDVVASVRVVPAAGECGAVEHLLVETLPASSQGGLHYDAASDTYTYVWKTPKVAGCARFELELVDGSVHSALFRLRS